MRLPQDESSDPAHAFKSLGSGRIFMSIEMTMRKRLAEHLVCPLDRTPLELVPFETRIAPLDSEHSAKAKRLGIPESALAEDVLNGALVNRARKIAYPIYAGVPRMLVFKTGVADRFVAEHGPRFERELGQLSLPNLASEPGEQDVLRTFSSEWVNYGWDGKTYWNLDAESWFRCMRYILDLEQKPVGGNKRVLEAGIGVGGVADHLSRSEDAEVIGVDLGYAVDAARKSFGTNPFLHIVQASVFAPPFKDGWFDFVYSFGVIHHTYSTKTAFERLSRLPCVSGRLFVWVYSPHDEERTFKRRVLMKLENAIRPWAWRLPETAQTIVLSPFVPLYMGQQLLRSLRGGDDGLGNVRFGAREALHAARDRFTPRYVHRHTEDEVMSWYRAAGYDELACSSRRSRPEFVPVAFTACTGVEGTRRS
jgi:uncharacterized protein YbaR (Trm112 family)